ncbi:hypothetical protein [Candidatus Nitrotoga sp. M5]|nr:hypothetical protein [Candidatus Nitrotoga sp. M5]
MKRLQVLPLIARPLRIELADGMYHVILGAMQKCMIAIPATFFIFRIPL